MLLVQGRPRLPFPLLGSVGEGVDARPVFVNVCFTFALLSLPTPRRRRITARLLNPLVTALSLRRCPPAAPQRSATQHKGPSVQAVDGVSVAIVT